MRYILLFSASLLIAGCSIIDRQGSPQVQDLTTSLGEESTVGRGKQVVVTIFATDADNDELDFTWTAISLSDETNDSGKFLNPRTSIPPQDTLIGVFQDTISIIWEAPSIPDVYLLQLQITDGRNTFTDSLLVEVTQRPPSAHAGLDQRIDFMDGGSVTLNGTGSTDPDEDDLIYSWLQINGPDVTLVGHGAQPFFTPLAAGDYVFRLRVYDTADSSNVSFVIVRVSDRGGG